MIPELKKFWTNYNPYKLHPEDENYLGQNKQKFCLEITIEELRKKYGSNLKSDDTRKKFINDKDNKNKILNNLFAVPFFGDVENAKIYILTGNPGFHTGDYVDEIEDKKYIELLKANLSLSSKTFICLEAEAINTGAYKYWSSSGRISKISKYLSNFNKKQFSKNYEFVKKSICIIESIAYHSCNKPNDELFNLPSSKLTKRLVNEYIQDRINENKAMCFVWRGVSFWNMTIHENLLLRKPQEAQLSMFKNSEAERMASFLNKNS